MSLRMKIIIPIISITILQLILCGINIPYIILFCSRCVYLSRYYLFRIDVKKTVVAEMVAVALSIMIPIALAKLPNIRNLLIWILCSVIVIFIEKWSNDNLLFIEEEDTDEY